MVDFTVYKLPHGRQEQQHIDRSEIIETIAKKMIEVGYRFEAEVLSTGHVSITAVDPDDNEDAAIEVVDNGPKVPRAVDVVVLKAMQHYTWSDRYQDEKAQGDPEGW